MCMCMPMNMAKADVAAVQTVHYIHYGPVVFLFPSEVSLMARIHGVYAPRSRRVPLLHHTEINFELKNCARMENWIRGMTSESTTTTMSFDEDEFPGMQRVAESKTLESCGASVTCDSEAPWWLPRFFASPMANGPFCFPVHDDCVHAVRGLDCQCPHGQLLRTRGVQGGVWCCSGHFQWVGKHTFSQVCTTVYVIMGSWAQLCTGLHYSNSPPVHSSNVWTAWTCVKVTALIE